MEHNGNAKPVSPHTPPNLKDRHNNVNLRISNHMRRTPTASPRTQRSRRVSGNNLPRKTRTTRYKDPRRPKNPPTNLLRINYHRPPTPLRRRGPLPDLNRTTHHRQSSRTHTSSSNIPNIQQQSSTIPTTYERRQRIQDASSTGITGTQRPSSIVRPSTLVRIKFIDSDTFRLDAHAFKCHYNETVVTLLISSSGIGQSKSSKV